MLAFESYREHIWFSSPFFLPANKMRSTAEVHISDSQEQFEAVASTRRYNRIPTPLESVLVTKQGVEYKREMLD